MNKYMIYTVDTMSLSFYRGVVLRARRFSTSSTGMLDHIKAVAILKEHGFRVRGDVDVTIESNGVTSKFKVTKDNCHVNNKTKLLITRDCIRVIPAPGYNKKDVLTLWNKNRQIFINNTKCPKLNAVKPDRDMPLL
jgi:hypothetical protein